MSNNRKRAGKWLVDALELELDAFLIQHRFDRRLNSHKYNRKLEHTTQSIAMFFQLPKAGRQSEPILLYPKMLVKVPEVNRVALEMVGGDERLLANVPDATLSEPLEFTAPKKHRIRWLFSDAASTRDVVCSVRQFLDDWGLPFLDGYWSAESVTRAFETEDARVLKQQHWYVYVAAAYIVRDMPHDAEAALSENLSGKWTREKYKLAFDYVARQLAG